MIFNESRVAFYERQNNNDRNDFLESISNKVIVFCSMAGGGYSVADFRPKDD
jgi:hypothetical protein